MRQPRELGEQELQTIAFKVRSRLEAKYGIIKLRMMFSDPASIDLLKETYIAVREQLETEHDRSQ